MLALIALQETSSSVTCPSCQARKVPRVIQITYTKANTSTQEAMAVSNVPGATPDPL